MNIDYEQLDHMFELQADRLDDYCGTTSFVT